MPNSLMVTDWLLSLTPAWVQLLLPKGFKIASGFRIVNGFIFEL